MSRMGSRDRHQNQEKQWLQGLPSSRGWARHTGGHPQPWERVGSYLPTLGCWRAGGGRRGLGAAEGTGDSGKAGAKGTWLRPAEVCCGA